MPSIPIVSGIYTTQSGDIETKYPRNLFPTVTTNGITAGYLRPGDGIIQHCSLPGIDRGGIVFENNHYRVCGDKFVRIDGSTATVLATLSGDPTNAPHVSFDYSFDYLAINYGKNVYLFDGSTVTQITDPDLGLIDDLCWIDGYFAFTDGEFIIVNELTDPFQINPLKYGSSEIDPDPVVAVMKIRGELVAINRHSIEYFSNVGGSGFPFQRINGAMIRRGAVGTHMCCDYDDAVAFVGSGRNEAIGVYIGAGGNAEKISNKSIDVLLNSYSEEVLSRCYMEARFFDDYRLLYIHLPDQTIVFDGRSSQVLKYPVWFTLDSSSTNIPESYRALHHTFFNGQWFSGDTKTQSLGRHVNNISSHYGDDVRWSISTQIIFNNTGNIIFHSLELVSLTGRAQIGANDTVLCQYSDDGILWSQPRYIYGGLIGERQKRLQWRRWGRCAYWRIFRFEGTSKTHTSIISLYAELDGEVKE